MSEENVEKKIKKHKFVTAKAVLLLLSITCVFVYLMWHYGYVASGNDAWGHLFKSNLLYENIKEGNVYPLYTSLWYNGVQPFRYWAPLPYYILAFLQWIAGGSITGAYVLFAGVSVFAGAFGWVLFGKAQNRIMLGTVLGLLWFFLPENIRVFFCEGNIPRMVTAIIIPYCVYAIWLFFIKRKNKAMFGIIACMIGITLSHVMIAAMVGIATFIFLLFYVLSNKQYKRAVQTLFAMLVSFAISGFWLLPALSGGLVGMDPEASASVMESLTYAFKESLNPMIRINGIIDTFYYGLSIVVISVIGALLAKKGKRAGFFTAIVIVLLTTSEVVPILSKMPLSQLLWMMRFATIAYAFFYWSLLEWTSIRRYFCIFLMGILMLDCIPSLNIERYYTQVAGKADEELELAKSITSQRVAILDLSAYGSYPSWELCVGEGRVDYSYGWAWQGAATSSNIVMLNTAVEYGKYSYVFDRCLELGNDTVVLPINQVKDSNTKQTDLISAALQSQYELVKKADKAYIFHRTTTKQFGVQTTYQGLAIGKNAELIVLSYPVFEVAKEEYVDAYSLEDLIKYKVLYLSGFQYQDKETAEELLRRAAQAGVRIVIDMSYVPEDPITKRASILGVTAQGVTFNNHYPDLVYKNNVYVMEDFIEENRNWRCTYIEGAKEITGSFDFMNMNLSFAGTNEQENIIFLGLNLLYHGLQTSDSLAYTIMNDVFGLQEDVIPERKIVPITAYYGKNYISIVADSVPVNTTIAYQDTFVSDNLIENSNNLLVVKDKQTYIEIKYPLFKVGLLATGVGIVLAILLYYWIRKEQDSNC
jgi:uncharacterized membrane protein